MLCCIDTEAWCVQRRRTRRGSGLVEPRQGECMARRSMRERWDGGGSGGGGRAPPVARKLENHACMHMPLSVARMRASWPPCVSACVCSFTRVHACNILSLLSQGCMLTCNRGGPPPPPDPPPSPLSLIHACMQAWKLMHACTSQVSACSVC